MTVIHPLTDEQKRRLKGKVLEDGERLHFSIHLMDAAAKASSNPTIFLTDADLDKAIRDQVSYEHGAHVAKFAFMGDRAPAFDRERAEFLARNRLMGGAAFAQDSAAHPAVSHASVTRSLSTARYSGTARLADAEAAAGGSMQNAGTSGTARPSAINALRPARYAGG